MSQTVPTPTAQPRFKLLLFVGSSISCDLAEWRTRTLCEKYLPGRCDLQVLNVAVHPATARAHQVIVTPTLLRLEPPPPTRVTGNFANVRWVLSRLGLTEPQIDEALASARRNLPLAEPNPPGAPKVFNQLEYTNPPRFEPH